jgi:hypothetical protein
VTEDDDDDDGWYGMGMNLEKTEKIRISRQTFPFGIMMNQKRQGIVEYFKCLGNIITNYAKCAHDTRYVSVVAKAAFKKNVTFHQQIGLKVKEKKLVKCYI